jgi:PucR C-terminal helix-turn-helix domain/GGDEF-like domain
MADYYTNALTEVLSRLAAISFLEDAVRQLENQATAIDTELRERVLGEIPAFTTSRNPDILPELARHGTQHTVEILRLLKEGSLGTLDFVRDHARRRAEQRFPLDAMLHAYRCGHKVYSRWLRQCVMTAAPSSDAAREAIAAVADFAIEYTDAISTIAAGTYSSHVRLLADVAGDQRAQLMNILLGGYDESDVRVTQLLREGGYLDQRLSFCIALARSVDPTEMLNPARSRRLIDAIENSCQSSSARLLIDLHRNKVTMIFSDPRRISGWTAPTLSLARRVSAMLSSVGNAVLVGVSNDVPSTAHIPAAYHAALAALELANADERVQQFSAIPTQRVLLYLAREEFRRVLPSWANAFYLADDAMRGALIATLKAYADADMNVLKAAARLSIHSNTIYARFQRIAEVTGLNAGHYHALNELLIVAECRPMIPHSGLSGSGQ